MQAPFTLDAFVAQSAAMQQTIANARKFAKLDAPLLIQGETGTGKDLLAQACVMASTRANEKFIAVNCAGLPADDAESEMFGHGGNEQTQATQGFFEYANGGTVLLDSVAELPLPLQAKLLRFINDGTFRRVGDAAAQYADVRVICTSQIPLQQCVEQGKMREDLFYRLNVLPLNLPNLQSRREDILPLAEQILCELKAPTALSPEVQNSLLKHHWAGNVRELYNVLYRATSLAGENSIRVEHLQLPKTSAAPFEAIPTDLSQPTLEQMMNEVEANILRYFYAKYPTTRKLASRLGLSHTAVANKLKQYGIVKPK